MVPPMDQEAVEGAMDQDEVEGAMDQEAIEGAMNQEEVEGAMGGTTDGSGSRIRKKSKERWMIQTMD